MASVLLLMLCSSCLSSSGVGAFFAGQIPGTSPHFDRISMTPKFKRFVDLSNELRLVGAKLPTQDKLPGDFTTKKSMTQTFAELSENAPELCELYDELTDENTRTKLKSDMAYYTRPGNESILTFGGFKEWKTYIKELMEPSDEMKASYNNLKLSEEQVKNTCTWQSQDEARKKCLPFDNPDVAITEMKDSCELLRDMLERDPGELVDDIITAKS